VHKLYAVDVIGNLLERAPDIAAAELIRLMQAAPAVEKTPMTEAEQVGQTAAMWLRNTGHSDILEKILRTDAHAGARAMAIRVLAQGTVGSTGEEYRALLEEVASKDPSADVRIAAIDRLTGFGQRASDVRFAGWLQSELPAVRQPTVDRLHETTQIDPPLAEAIIVLLNDSRADTRAAAAQALARHEPAFPAVYALLEDTDPSARRAAAEWFYFHKAMVRHLGWASRATRARELQWDDISRDWRSFAEAERVRLSWEADESPVTPPPVGRHFTLTGTVARAQEELVRFQSLAVLVALLVVLAATVGRPTT
jgi:hypothetical protein